MISTSKALKYLKQITSIPTASGLEADVVRYILKWARTAGNINIKHDKYGNLLLSRKGGRSLRGGRPVIFAAHLDHPAFVVTSVSADGKEVWADFRGGVHDQYFVGTKVRLYRGAGRFPISPEKRNWLRKTEESGLQDYSQSLGQIELLQPVNEKKKQLFKRVRIRFKRNSYAQVGDMIRWAMPGSKVVGKRLKAPACDDLAAVAASISAFESIFKVKNKHWGEKSDVRLLFTRSEEIGFIGAIGACKSGLIPKNAQLVALENSMSDPHDSPIGAGPIVRVGDRMTTFNDELNHIISKLADSLAKTNKAFCYQRKLMSGGACESSAYQSFGYQTTCLCLPLGNYHNMNAEAGKIDREMISTDDYINFVRLLIETGRGLSGYSQVTGETLADRLEKLFAERQHVLFAS